MQGLDVNEAWSKRILFAIQRAERMSFRFNQPCHIIDQPNLQVDVRLESNVRPSDNILETVNPPSKRQFK